jgi:hypothetical protein
VSGDWPELGDIGASEQYPTLSVALYWVAMIVFYGFGEEVGWRGFALPHMQETRSALRLALLLSIPWGLWHLPLFAFAEGLQELGLTGLPFWYGSILVGSVLATWLFNSSGSGIAVVAIFHGVLDIAFRRVGRSIGRGGHSEHPAEARRERSDAAEPDGEADVRDRAVGRAEERRRALEPPVQEVLVRRFAERAAELPAEVRGRELGGARECLHLQLLAVPRIHEVPCAEKVPGRMRVRHGSEYACRRRTRAS